MPTVTPTAVAEGDLLWTPSAERIAKSHLTAFMAWLAEKRGLRFANFTELWKWSSTDLEGFWGAIWDYFEVESSAPYTRVLGSRKMPGAEWFPGAMLNYAQHALRHERPDTEALLFLSEREPLQSMQWTDLANQVRVLAPQLRAMGLKKGDRVAAYLPNTPVAVIAMFATTSIGAIWASVSPDFGASGVVDRFSQLSPKIIFCVDGYQYGGKPFDRRAEITNIIGKLPSIEHVIFLPYLNVSDRTPLTANTVLWDDVMNHPPVAAKDFVYEQVPFDYPLWTLFSSGTTGLPKPIVHSHGGIILEQLKHLAFNYDVHPRERMFFFTSTTWMLWNFLASSLLSDVVPVLYDGNPGWPAPDVLWKIAQDTKSVMFGASPPYIAGLDKNNIVPKDRFDLSNLQAVTLAGSPVSPECMAWIYKNVKEDLWVVSGSGGTDLCTGFISGASILPVYAGEIQARSLGAAAYAFNSEGKVVVDEVGELVLTEPMPSMPIGFWNDTDGSRYRESYFDEFPGIWRHGDFFRVNQRGGCFVLGRSDATLNRHGIRIGTAEIYRSLANLDEVEDSLIVNLDLPGGKFFMPLFVKLRPGLTLDDALRDKIRLRLKQDYSPRHVPDRIYQIEGIPYTLTGKKMEVPVRRILMGVAPEKAANRDAVANPQALDLFTEYARTQTDYSLQ